MSRMSALVPHDLIENDPFSERADTADVVSQEVNDDDVAPSQIEVPQTLQAAPVALPSRKALFKRLADVVCLPESRINSFERSVTADLLVDMLRDASLSEREKVAQRLSQLNDIPTSLTRLLLIDDIQVAAHLITGCDTINDTELHYCARHGGIEHRILLAFRRNLTGILSEDLVEHGEPRVIEALLRNMRSAISHAAIESIVVLSQDHPDYIPLLLKRPELRPSSAYIIFWWASCDHRRLILSRFGVNREVMQDMAADVFAMAAKEGWQDPLSRKALQFIERRQRNRDALKKSPFTSLEIAIAEAARSGMNRRLAEEISYLSGIKPATGSKILRDKGGEGIAVLCKATGLPKKALRGLWMAMRRPIKTESGEIDPVLEKLNTTYDMLAVDRAQTVLRYWNWSLSSALTPNMLKSISEGESFNLSGLSVPERAAVLAFSQDLR